MARISTGHFEAIDGTLMLREVGGQVFLEVEGDNFHCSLTLNDSAVQGIADWFLCLRMSK